MGDVLPAAEVLSDQKLQHERAILGACLLASEAWDTAVAELAETDFSNTHRPYWRTMKDWADSTGAAPNTTDLLAQFKAISTETDHVSYVLDLTDAVSRTSNIGANIALLKTMNSKLSTLDLITKLTNSLYKDQPDEIATSLELQAAKLRASSNGHKLELIDASVLAEMVGEIKWLWKDWLPKGFATVISGATGQGKSMLAQALVSRFVSGERWPDGAPNSGKHIVVWHETEGKQALFTNRAKEMGYNIQGVKFTGGDGAEHLNLAKAHDVSRLQNACEAHGAELLVVDALYLAHDSDENAGDIRHVVHYLSELARTSNLAVLIIHHLRKQSSEAKTTEASLDDIRGSSTIVNACAVAWLLDKPDPENDMLRLRVGKSNFSELCDPLGFWIDSDGAHFETELDMVPRCPKKKLTALEMACEIIKAKLRSKPLPYQDLLDFVGAAGITDSTLQRAKKKLRLVSSRSGFGPAAQTMWSLPSRYDDDDPLAG